MAELFSELFLFIIRSYVAQLFLILLVLPIITFLSILTGQFQLPEDKPVPEEPVPIDQEKSAT